MGLTQPTAVRRTKPRLSHHESAAATEDDCIDTFVQVKSALYECFDIILKELDERLCSDGLKLAVKREDVLLEAARQTPTLHLEDLQLPPSFNLDKLEMQLTQLKDFLDAENVLERSVQKIPLAIGKRDRMLQCLFSEVIRLLSLCLCQPCSNASSERAFSTLRRLKTWQRTSIGQKRLTHLSVMASNNDILNNLDREKLIREFISRTSERRSVFGSF